MIPPRIALATTNRGKVAELRALVDAWGPVEVTEPTALAPVEETGTTYAENAIAKARAVAAAVGLPALADDSGLEVHALDGAPGLDSARWAGADATDTERVERLLAALRDVPDDRRGARFRCVVALAWPDGHVETAEGTCTGHIARAPAGGGGFGYDPVFVSADLGRAFAAVPADAKRRVSHRARAMRALGARLGAPGALRPARPSC